ncbi:MAG: hypothetical protein ABEJ91_01585 [Candidatus Nanohaloarchaea archaeon]
MEPGPPLDRRQLLYAAIAVIVAAAAALLWQANDIEGEARIAPIKDIEMETNSTTTFSFNASNVDEMHYYAETANGTPILWGGLDLMEAEPFPRLRADTLPPYWQWQSTAKEVEGRFLVNTTGLEPGVYNVTVEAWNHEPGDHNHTGGASEEFQLEVSR